MKPMEVLGKRAHSEKPIESRWQPVDLVCERRDRGNPADEVVRCKLLRGQDYAAMSISEAVGHRILSEVGITVAEARIVLVTDEFAATLTAQYAFDPAVLASRHWGTRLINDALETVVDITQLGRIRKQSDVFKVYLADVVFANADRATQGNVLFVPEAGGAHGAIVAIDQSDCFFGPAIMRTAGEMLGKRDRVRGQILPALDRVVLDGGVGMVEETFAAVVGKRSEIVAAVNAAPDEWYSIAGITPDELAEFLDYRVSNLETLGRIAHWRGIASQNGGTYVLF